jgi:hypothetical protein
MLKREADLLSLNGSLGETAIHANYVKRWGLTNEGALNRKFTK